MKAWQIQERLLLPSLKCIHDGCTNKPCRRGFCFKHRMGERPYDSQQGCKVQGCSKNHSADGYCATHYRRNYHQRLKLEVFEILGQFECIRCGFSDIRALQLDHIHGDGHMDRSGGIAKYRVYILNPEEARRKLQVLCANCNWIKRHENREFGGDDE